MAVRLHASRADVGGNRRCSSARRRRPQRFSSAARIDAHTGPGDVVADLAARGGWVARAAVDRQRRAVSIETSPLTRMLAEVVLRPPDVRHLDAAFQGMSASPRGESPQGLDGRSLRDPLRTCGRMLVADEFTWSSEGDGPARPIQRHYRCTVCRDMRGGPDARHGELDPEDVEGDQGPRRGAPRGAWARDRFPVVDGAPDLVDELLDMHTPAAARPDSDHGAHRGRPAGGARSRRAAAGGAPCPPPVEPAGHRCRPRRGAARPAATSACRPRPSGESEPWLGSRTPGPSAASSSVSKAALGPCRRLGEDLQALAEGSATAVLAAASPSPCAH